MFHHIWLRDNCTSSQCGDRSGGYRYLEAGVGANFLGVGHTMQHYKTANFRAELSDANPFEQWTEAGSKDMQQRAYERWNRMLAEYETPAIDPAIDEALLDFVARKKASMEDAWY